jgi:hypothetical protein
LQLLFHLKFTLCIAGFKDACQAQHNVPCVGL